MKVYVGMKVYFESHHQAACIEASLGWVANLLAIAKLGQVVGGD